MNMIAEMPKTPMPHVPSVPETPHPHVQPPSLVVYERVTWEYRVVDREADEPAASMQTYLDSLGNEGWELVAIRDAGTRTRLTLKRPRA